MPETRLSGAAFEPRFCDELLNAAQNRAQSCHFQVRILVESSHPYRLREKMAQRICLIFNTLVSIVARCAGEGQINICGYMFP